MVLMRTFSLCDDDDDYVMRMDAVSKMYKNYIEIDTKMLFV